MFSVYILRSASTNRLYVGQTSDLERRLIEHQTGVARYTRGRGPWVLVLAEQFDNRADAMRRERFLKSGQGRETLKSLLRNQAEP